MRKRPKSSRRHEQVRPVVYALCRTPGKRGFTSRWQAKQVARRMNGSATCSGRLSVYLCDCGQFHVGHLPGTGERP